jgi:phosphoglycerate dehydrogenase-like enzyme
MLCPEITEDNELVVTNAKGIFSSSLAEYVMGACTYFAKDIPRLIQQRKEKKWDRYCVGELRGKTMGIIGYGDIGRATAILAKAYGMTVYGLRKTPEQSANDTYVDRVRVAVCGFFVFMVSVPL